MNVNFNGYGESVATFLADENVKAGNVVKISDNYTVTNASAGEDFIGVCLNVRDGYAAVQIAGYVELAATKKITLGKVGLAASNEKKVGQSSSTSTVRYNVIYSTDDTVGFIL